MRASTRGFSLLEMMVALTLGLVVVLGVSQIFVAAKGTFVSQNAAATMQEDARFVLSKMMQEIRMTGMVGCVATVTDSSANGSFSTAYLTPISWDNTAQSLTLMTADVGTTGSTPTWTVLSDCLVASFATSGATAPGVGQIAIPLRQVVYTFRNNQLFIGPTGSQLVLINNVTAFTVTFGVANTAADTVASSYSSNPSNPALIRSVRLSLTLNDPANNARSQVFNVVAALRNRLR